jgi:Ribosomal protein L23
MDDLISLVNAKRNPPQALLYVPPKMTKTEVKEYLTKIYNVNVLDVMTANFLGEYPIIKHESLMCQFITNLFLELYSSLGKWKRLYSKRQVVSYKRRNFKKALVEFEAPSEPKQ